MRDSEVRQAFHQTVLKPVHLSDGTIIVNELGLKNGIVRADIAVLNGKMVGYEIKTKRDTLIRLPRQIDVYNAVFDEAFIITSNNHLTKVEAMIPAWWGIYEIIEQGEGSYSFMCRREGGKNASQDSFTIAQLLWKTEALELAGHLLQDNVKSSHSKKEIYKIICRLCGQKELSQVVIHYLKKRDNWRANQLAPSQNDD